MDRFNIFSLVGENAPLQTNQTKRTKRRLLIDMDADHRRMSYVDSLIRD